MNDLETLIPQALELVIDGEPLAIQPLKVGQMPAFLRAITPVMQQIGGDGAGREQLQTQFDVFRVLGNRPADDADMPGVP